MERLGSILKEASLSKIKGSLKESESFFIINYSGVASAGMSNLRRQLKDAEASVFVIKNTVARKAFKDLGLDDFNRFVDGSCGIVFVKNEPVGVFKALYDFTKTNENLKITGGRLKDKLLEKEDVEQLAKLPSKEVLLTQLVVTLKSPITGLVRALGYPLQRLTACLDQIKQKKG